MQLEPLGKFGYAQFIYVAEKLFKHVERVRDRLNYVVCFVASDHRFSSPAATAHIGGFGAVWKSVLI